MNGRRTPAPILAVPGDPFAGEERLAGDLRRLAAAVADHCSDSAAPRALRAARRIALVDEVQDLHRRLRETQAGVSVLLCRHANAHAATSAYGRAASAMGRGAAPRR